MNHTSELSKAAIRQRYVLGNVTQKEAERQ